ncbi:hypothetical protein HCUR_00120 [Holospora curviuscula]|uniref:Uncharacterized protein n=2 Tax=Holospora curviuscula TaxID=1082868 RepID=A0A2S5RHQ7_9PROT|nr:hypothetical protein HCUR_00120 [Holospora curviuscula]
MKKKIKFSHLCFLIGTGTAFYAFSVDAKPVKKKSKQNQQVQENPKSEKSFYNDGYQDEIEVRNELAQLRNEFKNRMTETDWSDLCEFIENNILPRVKDGKLPQLSRELQSSISGAFLLLSYASSSDLVKHFKKNLAGMVSELLNSEDFFDKAQSQHQILKPDTLHQTNRPKEQTSFRNGDYREAIEVRNVLVQLRNELKERITDADWSIICDFIEISILPRVKDGQLSQLSRELRGAISNVLETNPDRSSGDLVEYFKQNLAGMVSKSLNAEDFFDKEQSQHQQWTDQFQIPQQRVPQVNQGDTVSVQKNPRGKRLGNDVYSLLEKQYVSFFPLLEPQREILDQLEIPFTQQSTVSNNERKYYLQFSTPPVEKGLEEKIFYFEDNSKKNKEFKNELMKTHYVNCKTLLIPQQDFLSSQGISFKVRKINFGGKDTYYLFFDQNLFSDPITKKVKLSLVKNFQLL